MKRMLPIIFIINTSLFIISLAIFIPIVFRPFYYYHINALDLPQKTGYTYNEIKESYDDVLDYCLLNKEFKTGILRYSSDGFNHFKDCKILFIVDSVIFILSIIILLVKKKYCKEIKFLNHNISYWSGILLLGTFLIILIITIFIGFDKIFDIFHNIFFFGKENWLFDPEKDEIIKILPQRFFMNCGILIISIISVISIILIIKEKIDILKRKNNSFFLS